jgi:hypothetical protein
LILTPIDGMTLRKDIRRPTMIKTITIVIFLNVNNFFIIYILTKFFFVSIEAVTKLQFWHSHLKKGGCAGL